MAESSPGGAEQMPSKCQFCNEDKIEVNCLICDTFLCQPCCDRIHSQSKKLQEHHIINLKDFGTEDAADIHRKVDLDNIECANHQGQKCVTYCRDCNKTICLSCLTSSHTNHEQSDLKSYYDKNLSFIQNLQGNINNDIPFFKNEERKLQRMLSEHEKEHNDLSDTISQQEQTIIRLVKNHAQNLRQELHDIYDPQNVDIQKAIMKISKAKDELSKRKESVDNILLSHKANEILNSRRSINSTLPEKVVSEIQGSAVFFFPPHLTNINIDSVFGRFHKVPNIELVSMYQTNLKGVSCSIQDQKDTTDLVIGSWASQKIQNIKIENDNVKVIKEETVKVFDMAMKQNWDILISTLENELKIHKQVGGLQTFKTFPNQFTLGIHVNKHKQIILGLSAVEYIGDVKENTNIQLVIMSEFGDIKHTYDFDKSNKRLFTWPCRIITCGDNICVTDLLNSSREGRVVMIDYGGNVKWTFPGAEGGVNDRKFYSYGLTVTSTDMILVCDDRNHCLLVLNQSGEVIVCHNVKNLGIEFPTSISIDTKSYVWVGCNTRKSDKTTAKLYQLKLV